MITLYACLGSGNCFKPWLVMKQLGIPHRLQLIDVLNGETRKAEYLSINPLGVVPYLRLENGAGIGESNAMLWYLAEDSWLMPATPEQRATALQWMFFEQSKLEPFISPARFFTTILPHMRAERAEEIANWQSAAEPGLKMLDLHLRENPYLVGGNYTIADIAVFGYTHVASEAGIDMNTYPGITQWINRVSTLRNFAPLSSLGAVDAKEAA